MIIIQYDVGWYIYYVLWDYCREHANSMEGF